MVRVGDRINGLYVYRVDEDGIGVCDESKRCYRLSNDDCKAMEPKGKVYLCNNCRIELGEIACSNSKGGAYCSAKCAEESELSIVECSQASPQVLDMLANLARRVTSLESQLRDTQGNAEKLAAELAELKHRADKHGRMFEIVEERVEMLTDDIVMLDERTQPKEEAIDTTESVTVPKWLIVMLSKNLERKGRR